MAGRSTSEHRTPTLSAILPNYNHGRYLPRALDALLAQSRPADEIIIIDDGSTDNSRDIIARYAEKHPSIRPLPNDKNIGVIPTLTRGFNAARGDYVYFAAADDAVIPRFFETGLVALAEHPDAGLFCGDLIMVDGISGQQLGMRPPVRPRLRAGFIGARQFCELLRRNDNFIPTGAALLRRDAVAWAGGFDKRLSTFADGYLVRKVALTFGLYYSPQAHLTWNVFPDGASRTTSTDMNRAKAVLSAVLSRMTNDPVFPDWYGDVFSRRWHFSLCRLAVQEEPVNLDVLREMGLWNETNWKLVRWTLDKIGGRAAQSLILALLWRRLRPFTAAGLVTTALTRFKKSSGS